MVFVVISCVQVHFISDIIRSIMLFRTFSFTHIGLKILTLRVGRVQRRAFDSIILLIDRKLLALFRSIRERITQTGVVN